MIDIKFIINTICGKWYLLNPVDEYNKGLCNFLTCLYSGADERLKNSLQMDWESDESFEARKNGRIVFDEEKKFIEHTLRERLKVVGYSSIEVWLKDISYYPIELAKIMGIAWARNGGYVELMKK